MTNQKLRIHLIAIGGAAMHNLALALHENGHIVTGSDDEIYNPALARLQKQGLAPEAFGWFPEKITTDIEVIILGMHARKDNPELLQAQALGLKIYSYPAYVYEHAKDKKRVVVAGSHGKTTTTSMIMHVLRYNNVDFDYLVGAQLEGFENMVRLSDAPIMIIEGDEYFASPLDLRPKMLHYKPHVAIVTGIAWDHINVFPKYSDYVGQFEVFIQSILPKGRLIYYKNDKDLEAISTANEKIKVIDYEAFTQVVEGEETYLLAPNKKKVPLSVFGAHNLANFKAAYHACKALGVTNVQFFAALPTFKGAAKRLQLLAKTAESVAYLDFAHAPSKVRATIDAFKAQYPERNLVACLELHTFSSLNQAFLPQYRDAMQAADTAIVYFSEHTLTMKKLPAITAEDIKTHFGHSNLLVFNHNQPLFEYLNQTNWVKKNLLLMTSGTFDGMNMQEVLQNLS